MDVWHGVPIPAGFTQCRWSTSGEPCSPLKCETENLFFPPLPPPATPPAPSSSSITINKSQIKSNKSYPSSSLTPICLPVPPPPPPFTSIPLSFLLLLPCLPDGVVICPLRGGESLTWRFAPLIVWHTVAQHGCHRLSRVWIRWPDYLPARFHFPHSHSAALKTDHKQSGWKQPNDRRVSSCSFHDMCCRHARVVARWLKG